VGGNALVRLLFQLSYFTASSGVIYLTGGIVWVIVVLMLSKRGVNCNHVYRPVACCHETGHLLNK
jgi:hypothetical protein